MEYKTLIKRETGEIVEKKSKFICTLQPVITQQEATKFIEEMRKKYWDATHNVYAYILLENGVKRYSDDGEPSGTSGIPSLNVLEGEGLYNVAAVITRYFGGTLLGTGGLVRAYSGAVKEAISNSLIVTRCLCDIISVKCSYSVWGRVENIFEKKNVAVKNVEYGSEVTAVIYEKTDLSDKLMEYLVEKTDSNVILKKVKEEYAMFDDKSGQVILS